MEKQKISEIAEVNSGIRVMRYQNPEGQSEYKILNLNNEKDYKIDFNNAETFQTEKEIPPKYILNKGDIIMKLTPHYTANVIDFEEENLTAPTNYAIIHITGDINPTLLCYYLNSDHIKRQINRVAEESSLKIIKIQNIKNFEIIRNNPEEEEIGAELISTFYKKKELTEKKLQIEEEILNNYLL